MSDYLNEVLDIAARMSQELQEFVDAGEESGSEMKATKDLLEEWNQIYHRSDSAWQNMLATDGKDDGCLIGIEEQLG